MRRQIIAVAMAAAVLPVAPAAGHVAHTVEPGETLWSIAAASNFTPRALAAANGLSPDAQVVVGSTLWIPSEAEAAASLASGVPLGRSVAASGGAPRPLGAYTVRPGETLSGIAARSGIPTAQLAWMNGLTQTAHVIAGTALKLPTGTAPASPQRAPSRVPNSPPYATPGRTTASRIGSIASMHGVSPSLAAAVAWQESGFDNGVVSAANARGVMQVLPGTWSWIERNLVRRRLDPRSTDDNVHAGVVYLGQLLRDAGGDPAVAVAAYYQGGASVRRAGMLPETRRYVENVMALRSRFGGP